MGGKTFSIEDIIADEVRKAVGGAPAAVGGAPVPVPVQSGGGGDFLDKLDIKSITGLLKEINIMMANKKEEGGGGLGAPAAVGGAPAPAGLPGVDCVPAQNPRPGPAALPAGITPDAVFDMVRGALVQVTAAIGDVKLSELDSFMTENKPVVVALISQEMNKL
jgi:hypothetical protein